MTKNKYLIILVVTLSLFLPACTKEEVMEAGISDEIYSASSNSLFICDMSDISSWVQTSGGAANSQMRSSSNTNYYGDNSPEIACSSVNATESVGISRGISPAINTMDCSTLTITFKYLFRDLNAGVTLKVHATTDKVNFIDSSWSLISQSDRTAGPTSVTMALNQNLNSATT